KQVKKILLHQANGKMDEAILEALYDLYEAEPPRDVMPMTISTLGNSSVATIPTMLDLICKGKMRTRTCRRRHRRLCVRGRGNAHQRRGVSRAGVILSEAKDLFRRDPSPSSRLRM